MFTKIKIATLASSLILVACGGLEPEMEHTLSGKGDTALMPPPGDCFGNDDCADGEYCEFGDGSVYTQRNPMGSEVCGWDGHQLVFQIFLPEGVSIAHRFTLGPQGERINVATTVRSDRVSYPFTLDRVFNRYDPTSTGIRCKQTLTRGRVCTTEAPEL